MREVLLAADIGGTKLAAGVLLSDGALLARCQTRTPGDRDGEGLYRRFVDLLYQALHESGVPLERIRGIGVGCGGPMRFPEGLVSPLNIPIWRDFPLRPRLEADFQVPVRVDNDAKAFALGEYWLGAGREARCLLAMVVSTGVGGGIVESGRLIDGAHGNAGHIGHLVVLPNGPRCACGAQGCLEAVASGTSLARAAREALARGVVSTVGPDATARDLAGAAAGGDRLALRLFRRAGIALGRGIAAAAVLLDLDRVVIGGGVSNASSLFLPALRQELNARARLAFTRDLEIVVSGGTVDAALAGAARLVLA
jgi:glucokinase